jgi:DNA-binding XRE family transcriptional regulator
MSNDPMVQIDPAAPEARRVVRRVTPPLSDVLVQLGGRIRGLRTRAGLSQADLGRPYISRAAVSAIEKGRATPSLRSLAHIAKQLDVTIAELLTEDDAR